MKIAELLEATPGATAGSNTLRSFRLDLAHPRNSQKADISSVRRLPVFRLRDLGCLRTTPADRMLLDPTRRSRCRNDRGERLLLAAIKVDVPLREGNRNVFLVEAYR